MLSILVEGVWNIDLLLFEHLKLSHHLLGIAKIKYG